MRMMLRGILVRCLGLVTAASALLAQQPGSYLHIDGATATAVGVLWSHGYDDDDAESAGLVRVLASCRLEHVRRQLSDALATGLRIGGDYSLVFAVVPGGDAERVAKFLATVQQRELRADALSDDTIALLVARAALAADDAEFVYPGDVMWTRARRQLGAGTAIARPPAGIATAIARLTPEAVRTALAKPVPMRVGVLGVVDADVIRAVQPLVPAAEVPVRGDGLCTKPRLLRQMSEDRNVRADSPYVSVAFPLPAGVDRAALALGVQVATNRAFRRWKMRGVEQQARAPFVSWSWLQAEPMVRICRRGEDPSRLLPGEKPKASVRDELGATQGELEVFLEDLRSVPPTDRELALARNALRSRLSLPGPGKKHEWASEPATLPGRLQVLLLSTHHGVDVAKLDTSGRDEVHRALRAVMQKGRGSWHALLPIENPLYGFRRR